MTELIWTTHPQAVNNSIKFIAQSNILNIVYDKVSNR